MSTINRDDPTGESDGRESGAGDSTDVNVGMLERVASAVVGGTLVGVGLSRRSRNGALLAAVGGGLLARGVRGRSRLYRLLGVDTTDAEHRGPGATPDAMTVEQSITVDGSPEELAAYWRDSNQLTRVFGHFAEVRPIDERRQHWQVDGPFGRTTSWEARIVEQRHGELLRWESVGDASPANGWSVRFQPAPAGRGTEVTLNVEFDVPGGRLGGMALARLGFVPETLVGKALHRFKSLVETGEIPTLDANPSGRGRGDLV